MKTITERFIVKLDACEREILEALICKGGRSKSVLSWARILLKADEGKTDPQNSEFSGVSLSTVFRVRRRFVEEGLEAAVFQKNIGKRVYRKLDGDAEATSLWLPSLWQSRSLSNTAFTKRSFSATGLGMQNLRRGGFRNH